MSHSQDTIIAVSTPPGFGALGVIRLSGPQAIGLVNARFSRDLSHTPGHRLVYGEVLDGGG